MCRRLGCERVCRRGWARGERGKVSLAWEWGRSRARGVIVSSGACVAGDLERGSKEHRRGVCAHGVCTLNWMSVSHSLSTRQSNSSPWSSSEALPLSAQASKLTLNCQLHMPKLGSLRGVKLPLPSRKSRCPTGVRGHGQIVGTCSSPPPRLSRIKIEDLGM